MLDITRSMGVAAFLLAVVASLAIAQQRAGGGDMPAPPGFGQPEPPPPPPPAPPAPVPPPPPVKPAPPSGGLAGPRTGAPDPMAGFEDPCDAMRARLGRLDTGVASYKARLIAEVPKEKQAEALRCVQEAMDYAARAKKALAEDDCDAVMQYGAGIRDALERSMAISGLKMVQGGGGRGGGDNRQQCDRAHQVLRWASVSFPDFGGRALKAAAPDKQAEISRLLDTARQGMEQGSKALESADCGRAEQMAAQMESALQEIARITAVPLPPKAAIVPESRPAAAPATR